MGDAVEEAFDLAAEKIGLRVTTVDPTPCFYAVKATEFAEPAAVSAADL